MRYRIFLSSPSDVKPERAAAARVVDRINAGLPPDTGLDLIMWEEDYYTADSTFQDQIDSPADCDLVVCILWGRLGSDLPENYRKPDGHLPTGTEYEFEVAYEQAINSSPKIPDILVYRKKGDPVTEVRRAEQAQRQLAKVDVFWKKWFRNEQGHFVAAFNSFYEPEDFEERFERNLRRWLDDREIPLLWTQGSPFRGLAPFDVEHAGIYFGRTREVERARARALANLVAGSPFLVILGPSGSGKSSLVRAGLLPRLIHSGGAGDMPRLDIYAISTPALLLDGGGGDWALGLAQVLFGVEALAQPLREGDFDNPERLASLFRRGGADAVLPVIRGLERVNDDQGMVLVLDQLEEIFVWDPAQAQGFAALIAELVGTGRIMVIATMRVEFQHRLDSIPALQAICGLRAVAGPEDPRTQLNIGTPSAADLRDMIVKPAQVAGVRYQGPDGELPGLAERIETASRPSTLPAMQLLLSELYERRDGEEMTHAAYDKLGGVGGVMASRGDAVLREVPQTVVAALPHLARALVRSDAQGQERTARRMGMDEFVADSPERQLAVALQDAGLLISAGNTLRLAHETLITGWDALKDCVLDNAKDMAALSRIAAQYRGFQQADKTGAAGRALLTGLPLQEALHLRSTWGAPALEAQNTGIGDFITRSARAARRGRVMRAAAGGLVAALVALVAFIGYEFTASERRAELRAHLGAAESRLRWSEWLRAAESAQAALAIEENAETRTVAMNALIEFGQSRRLATGSGNLASVTLAPDGVLWQLQANGVLSGADQVPVSPPLLEGDLASTAPVYLKVWALPDGRAVALRQTGQTYLLPNSPDAKPIELGAGAEAISMFRVGQAAFHSVGDVVSIAMVPAGDGPGGRMLRCDLSAPAPDCAQIALPIKVVTLAFSAAGDRLVMAHGYGDIVLAAAGGDMRALPKLPELPSPPQSLAWLAQDRVLVAGLRDGRLAQLVFDETGVAASGWAVLPLPYAVARAPEVVQILTPGPQQQKLAYGCAMGRLCIMGIGENPEDALHLENVLYRRDAPLRDLIWGELPGRLYSVQSDGTLRQWDVADDAAVSELVLPAEHEVTVLATAPRQARLAVGDAAGGVTILGEATGPRRQVGISDDDEVEHLAFSAQGELAALTADGVLARGDTRRMISQRSPAKLKRLAWLANQRTIVASGKDQIAAWSGAGQIERIHRIHMQGEAQILPVATFGGIVANPDGKGAIFSISNGALYNVVGDRLKSLLPAEISADRLSAFSLDTSPDGRFLVASRSDDRVRIYDLSNNTLALELVIPTQDSRVVRFSPDGRKLAVLASVGRVHVWTLSEGMRGAQKWVSFDPAPSFSMDRGGNTVWLDWFDNDKLAVAHQRFGAALYDLSVDVARAHLARVTGRP